MADVVDDDDNIDPSASSFVSLMFCAEAVICSSAGVCVTAAIVDEDFTLVMTTSTSVAAAEEGTDGSRFLYLVAIAGGAMAEADTSNDNDA